jgi:hypothetical protein
MVLIYGVARGLSELTRQIYGERFLQGILPNARTFVNVVQHLREMNKRYLGSHFSCKIYSIAIDQFDVHISFFIKIGEPVKSVVPG